MMMIHGVVRKLSQRRDGALLVKRTDDQIPIDALDQRRVDGSIRMRDDGAEVNAFCVQLRRHIRGSNSGLT